MPATTDTTYGFDKTHMGGVRVRVRTYDNFTVEDLVETRAQSLSSSLLLEQRRKKLAQANPALQTTTFIAELE